MKKLTNKKGFTLMEMLIVVAIIAVLVAIAIPVFNGALTKSKEAADVANIRAAYAEYQVKIVSGETATWTDPKLNYADKFTKADSTLTYTASKLVNEAATDAAKKNEFTWTLSPELS